MILLVLTCVSSVWTLLSSSLGALLRTYVIRIGLEQAHSESITCEDTHTGAKQLYSVYESVALSATDRQCRWSTDLRTSRPGSETNSFSASQLQVSSSRLLCVCAVCVGVGSLRVNNDQKTILTCKLDLSSPRICSLIFVFCLCSVQCLK